MASVSVAMRSGIFARTSVITLRTWRCSAESIWRMQRCLGRLQQFLAQLFGITILQALDDDLHRFGRLSVQRFGLRPLRWGVWRRGGAGRVRLRSEPHWFRRGWFFLRRSKRQDRGA